MALLEYVSPDVDDDRLQELFAEDAAVYGRPSLFARMLAHDPDVLAARQAYVGSLTEGGTLSETEAELAYVAVAAANDCSYCVASHTERLVEHVGIEPETVESIAAGDTDSLTDRQEAIVSFARSAASEPKRIDERELDRLREHGFEDADLVRLVAIAGAAVSANVIADALNLHPADQPAME